MTVVPNNRQFLKVATQTAHQSAETRWVTEGRFANQAAYVAWLTAMAGVHVTLGASAARRLGDRRQMEEERCRIHALETDLAVPLRAGEPVLDRSSSWAWGVAYALNGSAMGASILLKSGAVSPGWPVSYLTELRSYATSGRLQRFFRDLDQLGLNRNEASDGARAVFANLAQARVP